MKKLDCAPLMGHYQFLQRRGEVKHVPPTIVQAAVLVMAFCEREIVEQMQVNQLPEEAPQQPRVTEFVCHASCVSPLCWSSDLHLLLI